MSVTTITTETQFLALRPVWQALHEANPQHTPFQSWEWNFTWWKYFGRPGKLRLMVVEQDGKPLGIAPLFLEPRYLYWPLRHLAFLGRKRADYLDFIVRAGAEAAFFAALFDHLRSAPETPRLLELRDFPQGSTNFPHIVREALAAFPAIGVETSEVCVSVPLPSTYEAFLKTLGKSSRRKAGRSRQKLEQDFQVRWHAPATLPEFERGFVDFVGVYRRRWEAEHGATSFDEANPTAFERDICRLGFEAGWYRLYILYVNEKAAAAFCGYVWNGKFYAALFGYVPDFAGYSVGSALTGMTIEHGIQSGWTEFDLTRGEETYKFHWGGRSKRNYSIHLSRERATLAWVSFANALYYRMVKLVALRRIRALYRRLRLKPTERTESVQPMRTESFDPT